MHPLRGAPPPRSADLRPLRRTAAGAIRGAAGAAPGVGRVHRVRRGVDGRRPVRRVPRVLPGRRPMGAVRGAMSRSDVGRRSDQGSPYGMCDACQLRRATDGAFCARCLAGDRPTIIRVFVNPGRRPLPAGTPLARQRYRQAGRCVCCGYYRDRPDRLTCAPCRRRLADAQARYRARQPPPDAPAVNAASRARRRLSLAEGRCGACGGDRDRPDRKTCAHCRARAAAAQRAHRHRRAAVSGDARDRPGGGGRRAREVCYVPINPAMKRCHHDLAECR